MNRYIVLNGDRYIADCDEKTLKVREWSTLKSDAYLFKTKPLADKFKAIYGTENPRVASVSGEDLLYIATRRGVTAGGRAVAAVQRNAFLANVEARRDYMKEAVDQARNEDAEVDVNFILGGIATLNRLIEDIKEEIEVVQ